MLDSAARHPARLIAVAAAIVAIAGSTAGAQVRARNGGQSRDRGGTQAVAPAPKRSLGGVRSEAARKMSGLPRKIDGLPGKISGLPRKMSGLGGRPVSFPQTRPLGPSNRPEVKPMDIRPWGAPPAQGDGQITVPTRPVFPTRRIDLDDRFERPFPGRPDVVVVPGSGLVVDGSYVDDRFRLGFHLGTPLIGIPWLIRDHNGPSVINSGAYLSTYSDGMCGPRYGLIEGLYATVDPALTTQPAPPPAPPQPVAPPVPETDKALGDQLLASGDAKAAVNAYRRHLNDNPDDAEAMLALGLALLDAAQPKEGVAMIGMAYRKEPALADSAIPLDVYQRGAGQFRENLRRVSVYANRSNSASAWLALSVLMQAEGRTATALTMLDRAAKAGLEAEVVSRVRSALGG